MPVHTNRRGGVPLVLVFHGGASSPAVIAKKSAMHRLGEEKGFAVAYPEGKAGGAGLNWSPGDGSGGRGSSDARFARRLILDLQRHYDINPLQIYAAGFSIGGSLVYELGCLYPELLAAIGVVGGAMISKDCTPHRSIPLIHIHGSRDRHVPYEGGRGPATSDRNDWVPVEAGLDLWRRINGCGKQPRVEQPVPTVKGYKYEGLKDVELWLVAGGGHFWPGARRDLAHPSLRTGFSASEEIWRFFAAHPRRPVMPRVSQPARASYRFR